MGNVSDRFVIESREWWEPIRKQMPARPGVPRMNEVIIGVTRVKGIQAMIRTGKMAVHGTESRRRVQAGTFRYFLSPESSIFEISKKWRLSTLRRKD